MDFHTPYVIPIHHTDSDDDIGPMPAPAAAEEDPVAKKRKRGKDCTAEDAVITIAKLLHCKRIQGSCNGTLTGASFLVGYIALPHEQLYISRMPSAEMYEKSYMHRDAINFVAVTRYRKNNTN